ncbi:MAG: hypothetical protein R3F61_35445 [Myxococcota bacterium]
MSYFDHVQCHSCGARMDPEKLVPGPGEMPCCPYCGQQLNMADLFGVKDAFVGHDDDAGNDHSLDDLVGGDLYDSRYIDGRPPSEPMGGTAPRSAPRAPASSAPARPAARPVPARKGLPGPTAGASARNAMVPVPRQDETPGAPPPRTRGGAAPSAADLLREMKKKR